MEGNGEWQGAAPGGGADEAVPAPTGDNANLRSLAAIDRDFCMVLAHCHFKDLPLLCVGVLRHVGQATPKRAFSNGPAPHKKRCTPWGLSLGVVDTRIAAHLETNGVKLEASRGCVVAQGCLFSSCKVESG